MNGQFSINYLSFLSGNFLSAEEFENKLAFMLQFATEAVRESAPRSKSARGNILLDVQEDLSSSRCY